MEVGHIHDTLLSLVKGAKTNRTLSFGAKPKLGCSGFSLATSAFLESQSAHIQLQPLGGIIVFLVALD